MKTDPPPTRASRHHDVSAAPYSLPGSCQQEPPRNSNFLLSMVNRKLGPLKEDLDIRKAVGYK